MESLNNGLNKPNSASKRTLHVFRVWLKLELIRIIPDQSPQSTDTSKFNKHDKYIRNTNSTNLSNLNTSNLQIPVWFLNPIKNVGI